MACAAMSKVASISNTRFFTRGWSMRTGKDRVQLDAMDVPVSIGGARVHPGDWLLGDADGVVCIPKNRAGEVIEIARSIDEAEVKIREAFASGMRLDEARKQFKYFKLQSKQ